MVYLFVLLLRLMLYVMVAACVAAVALIWFLGWGVVFIGRLIASGIKQRD